jgi:hypothetical protein
MAQLNLDAWIASSKSAIARKDEQSIRFCIAQCDLNYDFDSNLEDEPVELDQMIEDLQYMVDSAEEPDEI